MTDIKMQMEKIRRGVAEIIGEEEIISALRSGNPLRVKFGVDPTSPDIHLGHTVVLNKLKVFQELGHKVVFIIGDFTARIGDPSGRTETRPMLDEKDILANASTYVEQVFKILDKDKTEVVYNSHWLYPLGVEGLLRLSRRATVAQMLHRADFAERYKNGIDITMLEFLYPLLQGYDSIAVKSDVEIGGTDQKFNLLFGRDLQRDEGMKPQAVITMPILEGLDGKRKMSKSYGNHIALNDSPSDMFGKIMSITDEMMYKWYELLTDRNLEEVKSMHPRDAKALLAETITARYHGAEAASGARAEFEKIFKEKNLPSDMPQYHVPRSKSGGNSGESMMRVSDVMVASGLAPSRSEALRLIKQGAVKLDGARVVSDDKILPHGKKEVVLQSGKRGFLRIIFK